MRAETLFGSVKTHAINVFKKRWYFTSDRDRSSSWWLAEKSSVVFRNIIKLPFDKKNTIEIRIEVEIFQTTILAHLTIYRRKLLFYS